MTRIPQALTIAGSDSGGGAGIQADIKTMAANGVFAASVVTAVTAQNTVAVRDAFELPPDSIRAQLEAVFDDFDVAAAKTGMLSSARAIDTIAGFLSERGFDRLVVDPVMISKGGYRLLAEDAVSALETRLLPLALVATPNLHEASMLSGVEIASIDSMKEAARRIRDLGAANVVVKGGHAEFARGTDVFFDGRRYREYPARLVFERAVHGTGCTFSAALTARLALGEALDKALAAAKAYVTGAIEHQLDVGSGNGPGHHFFFITPWEGRKR